MIEDGGFFIVLMVVRDFFGDVELWYCYYFVYVRYVGGGVVRVIGIYEVKG